MVPAVVLPQQRDQFHDLALLDDQAAVHVGLAGADARVHHDLALGGLVDQPDADVGKARRALAESGGAAVRARHGQGALADGLGKETVEYRFAHRGRALADWGNGGLR